MTVPDALWTSITRALAGTGVSLAHAKTFLETYVKNLILKFGLGLFQLDTGLTSLSAGASNTVLLAFAVPTGKTLKIWEYGVTAIGADVSWNIFNSTDSANVISPAAEVLLTSPSSPETPLATVAAGKTVQVRGSNAGAGAESLAAFVRCTLE